MEIRKKTPGRSSLTSVRGGFRGSPVTFSVLFFFFGIGPLGEKAEKEKERPK